MFDVEQEWTLDWRCKGFPLTAAGLQAAEIADAGWNLHADFTTPVAVLKESALAHNVARMQRYCADHGVHIAPHGKTTMSPELISRQLAHGAWGMTAATAWQAQAMLRFGARRVMIANECVDPVGLRVLADHMRRDPDVEIFVFADSVAAVDTMRRVLSENGEPSRPLPVLVEVGVSGGRAGAREVTTAVDVGRAVAASAELELAGVAGFEGVIGGRRVPEVVTPVRAFLARIRETAEKLMAANAFRETRSVILSAGGSAFFDQVADVFTGQRYTRDVEVVIRSGCYLSHDHGTYLEASPFADGGDSEFRPALEVWSRVLSTPEAGLAIIDAGKRDVSTDERLPPVLGRRREDHYAEVTGVAVERCNDQHGFLRDEGTGDDALRVGDVVALGVSHPCTTFDKWRVIPVVDDAYRVISAVRTFF